MKKSTFQKKLNNIAKTATNKVINTTATVLAAPAILKSKYIQHRSDGEFNVLKMERGYKGAPDFDNGVPTDAFKIRVVADAVRDRIKKRNSKKKG